MPASSIAINKNLKLMDKKRMFIFIKNNIKIIKIIKSEMVNILCRPALVWCGEPPGKFWFSHYDHAAHLIIISPNSKGLLAAGLGEFWALCRKQDPRAPTYVLGWQIVERSSPFIGIQVMMLGPEAADQEEGMVRTNLEGKA